MAYLIPFNRPALVGQELTYIQQAVHNGKLSGNGAFTQLCQKFFEQRYGIHKALLTTSGTDALELAALLLDIQPGDEVIMPSYTFTSTANAFILRGAHIVFADSQPNHPNLDADHVARLITSRTRAIVPVHYAGDAAPLEKLLQLTEQHGLWLVEDAAQAIESRWQHRHLGTVGHLAAFSFHETKNISAGEGGLLAINDARLLERAEILWEKGTNRAAFFRGEAAQYEWIDVGSSFLPSELNAAYLWAQLEQLEFVQCRRQQLWERYHAALRPLAQAGSFFLPFALPDTTPNYHLAYLVCRSQSERDQLITYLAAQGILAVFHYQPLHASPYYTRHTPATVLPHAERFGRCLVRLPLFHDLSFSEQDYIIWSVQKFYS